jgi:DNA primase
MRQAAPLVAKIKDREKRPEYARKLAGDLGMEVEPVLRAVATAAGRAGADPGPTARAVSTLDSPQRMVEREALKLALQVPVLAGPMFDSIADEAYLDPVHAAVRAAIAEAGGASAAVSGAVWVERVREACADLAARSLVGELAVDPLHLSGDPDPRYVGVTLARLQLPSVTRRIQELKSKLQRLNPVTHVDEHLRLFGELVPLEQHARALREQAVGG